MIKTVSVKDLRLNFAAIRKDLSKGVKFIVIYRSSPIGELTPIDQKIINKKDIIKKIPSFRSKKKFSAVSLVRSDRE